MRPSRIAVHIDEIVLHGLSRRDAAQLEADLQRELMQVIVERGVSPALASQRVARVDGGALRLQPNSRAHGLAKGLAEIVYQSIGGERENGPASAGGGRGGNHVTGVASLGQR
jgi:hypothetical protein